MDRRTLLSTVGTGIAVAVAGCMESGGDGDGAGSGGAGTADPTDTDSPTTTEHADDGVTEEGTTGNGTTDGSTDGTENGGTTDDVGTPEDSGAVAVADTAFEVTSNQCGGSQQSATVSADGSTVTVEGVARGSDACHTARLAGTSVDGGTLTVSVESYVPESEADEMCQQCLVDIEYTATVTTSGGAPESVVVMHGDEQVTRADALED
ncbi:hypothetical protein [Halomarina oriensis]|uniref:Lipoprotein n=1 Tax=Halomarina oriensis TaxID=671145 RepID=A0A6B0GDT7_9EURY|nr:hypothetical protein [Halomarina oriensis]MWG33096.1 hypothetical protein [Halomarina oriensis]